GRLGGPAQWSRDALPAGRTGTVGYGPGNAASEPGGDRAARVRNLRTSRKRARIRSRRLAAGRTRTKWGVTHRRRCRRSRSSMAHPYLAFCPYLSVRKVIEFADWELGPVEAFDERWSDAKFKAQSKAFLAKFVDSAGKPIEHPSLLCR